MFTYPLASFNERRLFFLGFVLIVLLASQLGGNYIIRYSNAQTEPNYTGMNSYSNSINQNQTSMAVNGLIQNVVIIIMENKGYSQIIDASDAPYQNQLAKNYASASEYYGVYPDSLPNYIAIISGYRYITDDKDPEMVAPFKNPTIVDLLQSNNLTWKGYFEDIPEKCYTKDSGKSGYIAHHNPFVYFDIRNDDRCDNTVGLDNFFKDLSNGTVPNYSFIVPNNIHNTHDSTVAQGDKWLSTFVPKIINSTVFANTALFIVYDEGQKHDKSGFGSGPYEAKGGRLPLILVSPLAREGFVSQVQYSHYNLLSTVEKILGLGSLEKGDSAAKPMMDLFQ